MTFCNRTLWYDQYTRGLSIPQCGVRSPNTFTSAAPRTYIIICISSESWVYSWDSPAPLFWCLTFRYIG